MADQLKVEKHVNPSPVGSPSPTGSSTSSMTPGHNRGVKIIDKMRSRAAAGKPFYSFEYFPPKTADGVNNLYMRIDRMSHLLPLFMDVTWGAGGSTADLTLDISTNVANYTSSNVMMHLTCTNMSIDTLKRALDHAKENGISNILALRGDPPLGAEEWEATADGFEYASDLVRYIRKEYGDYFCVAVAGYPENHMNSVDWETDIKWCKEKVDAGADFIITQLFYDCDRYLLYVERCRAAGIMCPIIPGIMPIQNYNGFKRMTGFCKTFVPDAILEALEPIKHDDARVKDYGVQLAVEMCQYLLSKGVPGLHFYTLNLEKSVTQILAGLNFISIEDKKKLPWASAKLAHRQDEDVRPIFWANRPMSYLSRTNTWDDFPNGRWGDNRSPAYGTLDDYHLSNLRTGSAEQRRKDWGSNPTAFEDIYNVFHDYLEGKVARLPWCDTAIQPETAPMSEALCKLNARGFLTINSQPRVSGVPSDDDTFGWGAPGGFIFQKAYIEFFTSADNLQKLIKNLEGKTTISYHAVNAAGKVLHNQRTEKGVNAVTWGVFPDREVIQPTVVDPSSFLVWKEEAFALWGVWQGAYTKGTTSWDLIERVKSSFFLVNIVDNDFINGDLYDTVFSHVLQQ